MELENTATEVVEAETDQEVAAPDESTEEGSNYEEVAKPQSEEEPVQSHEDNAKFQEYRHKLEDAEREREELRRELEELKSEQSVRDEVLSEYLNDDTDDVNDILADAFGISTEELKAKIETKAELERLKAENEKFKAEKEEAERREQEARENEALTIQLAEISKIDPSIKTINDFEEKFAGLEYAPIDYLEKGHTLKQTYWSLMAELNAKKRTPPPEAGGVKGEQTEKPHFTREDVMAMTPEERTKNWKAIRAAQMSGKW